MRTLIIIIIIVVVVVVDDDTYYWVYLSSDHLFQVYYKVRQVLLQSPTAFFITKCDSLFITKCDKCYYKVRQVLQSMTILLQSATIITKCDSTGGNIGKENVFYDILERKNASLGYKTKRWKNGNFFYQNHGLTSLKKS